MQNTLLEKKLWFLIGINANRNVRNSITLTKGSVRERSGKNNKIKQEATMTTVGCICNLSREMTCEKCGEALIAPEYAEYVSERLILNLWSCTNCGYRFETEALAPTDAELELNSSVLETFFPSLLVA
jgi:ribosomal protein L37AE/L43A